MSQESLTGFSGVAGKVLQRAIGGGSLITGIVVGFFLVVATWVLVMLDAVALSTPLIQLAMAVVLARFAVNGLHGEWGGTIFSSVGGPWTTVLTVAARYLALTAIWLLPMLLLGLALQPDAETAPMMPSGKLMTFAAFYVLALTLTPPVFLIVSVGAESFGEIFSPPRWRAMFSGRQGDLFAVYVVYTGALAMVALLAITPVALAFTLNTNLGFVVAGLGCILLFGVSINLLGRLSGFFACGELGPSDPPARALPLDPATSPAGAHPLAAAPPVPRTASMDVDAPPLTAPGVAARQPLAQAPAAPVSADAATAAPSPATAPAVDTATTVLAAPQIESHHDPLRVAPNPKRRPPLLDGQQRVEAAMKRFAMDPDVALTVLKDLNESFAPHPHVLQAYASCLYQTGHTEVAVELGREALRICLDRGQTQLAAGLFAVMYRDYESLGFSRDQLLVVGGSLERSGNLALAARAYSTVIGEDRASARAIKGLLQVAERILNERAHPEAAIKVYRYLMEHCSDSPLRGYMVQGRAAAERALAARSEQGL